MKKIDSSTETILGVTYDLYSVKLSELKTLAKSWYEGVDLKKLAKKADAFLQALIESKNKQ